MLLRKLFIISLLFISGISMAQYMQPSFYKEDQRWADSVLNSLSLEEKIAQLIMVKSFSNKGDKHVSEVAELVNKYRVGGVIFFQGGPVRQVNLTNFYQSISRVPLLIGIDGEWGLSMRLDSTLVYPKQMCLGAIQYDTLIYQMGADVALQLKRMGAHMNFAPVVDINNNPRNPVIGSRSFGEDKNTVARKGLQYMWGLQDNRVLATAKHFPGHGDTDADSHYTLPVLSQSKERIDTMELYPFECLMRQGVSSIMTAHLSIPALDSSTEKLPASLSPQIVTGLLKDELGYTGIVFTDALNMKGSANYGRAWEVGLKAFLAGNDILLMPDEVPTLIGKICDAVQDSLISATDIDRRCKKILMCKKWLGLDHFNPVSPEHLYEDLNSNALQLTGQRLAESSLTLLKNNRDIIPVKRLDTLRIASLSVGRDSISVFQQYCERYAPVKHFCIRKNASVKDYDSLMILMNPYNLVLVSLINTDVRVTRNYGVDESSVIFIKNLTASKAVIFSVFASPYVLPRFGDDLKAEAIVMAYEDKDVMQRTAAQLIFGGIAAKGKLPVTASAVFERGSGIDQSKIIRMKYTVPEDIGVASGLLNPIDSIIQDAIAQHAMPGCQVLLAKDGKVFYNRAFGYHTYDSILPVKTTDIYDVASITKVAATVPAIIKLYDNSDISLSRKLGSYFPVLRKSDKKDITIKEILMHQSGLQAWVPMYLSSLKPASVDEKLISKKPTEKISTPVHDFFINNNVVYNSELISDREDAVYAIPVAPNLYTSNAFRDTVLLKIKDSKLFKKEYKYSDLGFILLKSIVETESEMAFDSLVRTSFYQPLGLNRTAFRPLNTFGKGTIVPTENDTVFRKQLVHGYVQDENCAMMGGISGHAGLFSNANDLAILMQMYLNSGVYGGARYLNTKHVDQFTACQYCPANRRGLGFDKPEADTNKSSPVSRMASLSGYGHTGYTGCMVWVDPQYQLVFIFLSNKIHPNTNNNKLVELNVRTKIQDVIYGVLKENELKK